MKANNKKIKEISMIVRQKEVESNHIRGKSAEEIAKILKVSVRTIERDIQEIRQKNLSMFAGNNKAKEWLSEQLADSLMSLKEAERQFWTISENTSNESVKLRSIWFIVQSILSKKEIFNSLGIIYENVQRNKENISTKEIKRDSLYEPIFPYLNFEEQLQYIKILHSGVSRFPESKEKEEFFGILDIRLQQYEAIQRGKKREEEFEYQYPNCDESYEDFLKRKAIHEASKNNIEKKVN